MPSSKSNSDSGLVRQQIALYLAGLSPDARRAVRQIRTAIKAAEPKAVETFSYGIPGFRFDGRPLVWCAGWTRHVSIYPIGMAVRRALASEIRGYKTAKGTIQFPLDAPMPLALVKKLVRARVAQVRNNERVN
jgi:uncharacterized protein YdhG (YjbR/CyaY superfamily)